MSAPGKLDIAKKLDDLIFGSSKSKQERNLDTKREDRSINLSEKKYNKLNKTNHGNR